MLIESFPQEIEAILAKYPPDQKRSAVMPLLFMAEREYGTLTLAAIAEVGKLVDLEPTEVGSLVGFYTLYHDRPGGKYRVQVCTDLPCALRDAEHFARELAEQVGVELGDTTTDGFVTIEEVKCLAACDKAPVFQVQAPDGIHYHEDQYIGGALATIAGLGEGVSGD